jgi:hypothetical protein
LTITSHPENLYDSRERKRDLGYQHVIDFAIQLQKLCGHTWVRVDGLDYESAFVEFQTRFAKRDQGILEIGWVHEVCCGDGYYSMCCVTAKE